MTNRITSPKIIGLPPPDLPPGKNLLIIFCKLPISSSKLGGSLLEPDPLSLPLLGPPEPKLNHNQMRLVGWSEEELAGL